MGYVQFFYFISHLSVKMFLLFSIANALVCGNVLVLRLTFWVLRKKRKEKIGTKDPMGEEATWIDMGTGKQEKWEKRMVWVRKD